MDGELFVIDGEEVEHCGVEIVHVDGSFFDCPAKFVGRADDTTAPIEDVCRPRGFGFDQHLGHHLLRIVGGLFGKLSNGVAELSPILVAQTVVFEQPFAFLFRPLLARHFENGRDILLNVVGQEGWSSTGDRDAKLTDGGKPSRPALAHFNAETNSFTRFKRFKKLEDGHVTFDRQSTNRPSWNSLGWRLGFPNLTSND